MIASKLILAFWFYLLLLLDNSLGQESKLKQRKYKKLFGEAYKYGTTYGGDLEELGLQWKQLLVQIFQAKRKVGFHEDQLERLNDAMREVGHAKSDVDYYKGYYRQLPIRQFRELWEGAKENYSRKVVELIAIRSEDISKDQKYINDLETKRNEIALTMIDKMEEIKEEFKTKNVKQKVKEAKEDGVTDENLKEILFADFIESGGLSLIDGGDSLAKALLSSFYDGMKHLLDGTYNNIGIFEYGKGGGGGGGVFVEDGSDAGGGDSDPDDVGGGGGGDEPPGGGGGGGGDEPTGGGGGGDEPPGGGGGGDEPPGGGGGGDEPSEGPPDEEDDKEDDKEDDEKDDEKDKEEEGGDAAEGTGDEPKGAAGGPPSGSDESISDIDFGSDIDVFKQIKQRYPRRQGYPQTEDYPLGLGYSLEEIAAWIETIPNYELEDEEDTKPSSEGPLKEPDGGQLKYSIKERDNATIAVTNQLNATRNEIEKLEDRVEELKKERRAGYFVDQSLRRAPDMTHEELIVLYQLRMNHIETILRRVESIRDDYNNFRAQVRQDFHLTELIFNHYVVRLKSPPREPDDVPGDLVEFANIPLDDYRIRFLYARTRLNGFIDIGLRLRDVNGGLSEERYQLENTLEYLEEEIAFEKAGIVNDIAAQNARAERDQQIADENALIANQIANQRATEEFEEETPQEESSNDDDAL